MKKVCVIDSGFSKTDKNINTEQIERAFTVEYGVNGFYISEGADDTIGHGTAVMTILQQGSNRNVLYTVIKIFDDQLECDENRLIYALQYVYENIDCDLINLSLGVTSCSHGKRLLEVCSKLYSRNTVIVSAFDNAGEVSCENTFQKKTRCRFFAPENYA